MRKRFKVLILTTAMIMALTAGTAWADEGTSFESIYVNGNVMNDDVYDSTGRLKPTVTLEDGALQIMDYVNEAVLVMPKSSGYGLSEDSQALETVLTNGQDHFSLKRHVFTAAEGSTDFMTAEKTVKWVRPAAVWQLQSWPEGDTYRVRALYHDAAQNGVLELKMTFAAQPTEEEVAVILDNVRAMTAAEKQAYLQEKPVMDLKKVVELDAANKQLIDYANGYTITYPQNMTVDASLGDIRTLLANNDCQIEIYRQPLEGSVTASAYKNYSNLFLQNTFDHRQQSRKQVKIDGMDIQVLTWQRPSLSHVQNDMPYYLSIDLVRDKTLLYTISIKSKQPLDENSIYRQALDSFTLIPRTGEVKPTSFINPNRVSPDKKPVNYDKWNAETKQVYDRYFGEESKLTWGIFEANAPRDFYTLKQLEKQVDKEFKFLLHYQHIPNTDLLNDLTVILNNAYREKRIIELTLQTTDAGENASNTIYRILDGEYDELLSQYAKKIADFGHPVLFRLCNEMNGDWCQYSAFHTSKDTQIYRELYHYIYGIFEEQGANKNTLWVWNPNERSFPDFSWNDARLYYPGDEYVDIVGITGYNTGNYYEGEIWRSFDEIYQPLYKEYVQTYDKPFMITEFASNSVGGDKSQWIREMFESIHKLDKIKVAIWWSGCDWERPGVPARIYYMNESPEILDTFKEMFKAEKVEQKAAPSKTNQK